MFELINQRRRDFLGTAAISIVMAGIGSSASLFPTSARAAQRNGALPSRESRPTPFGVPKQIRAGQLDVGYFEFGPSNGRPVLLLHGFPYDVHSYVEVAPTLTDRGCRVIVPFLRGHGSTTFLESSEPRSGQQAAIGADVIDLMNALKLQHAVLAGYDWGGRAACVVAALWPERCNGLVSVNSYLIQDIANAAKPLPAKVERGLWYQFYFQTERGRAGLRANREDIARIMWANNSPTWGFDETTFQRSVAAFHNVDYVDVVIHSYRHRLGLSEGFPRYADIERRLAALPVINVPTITLDSDADGVIAATDGKASAHLFTDRQHRVVHGAGHNLPQESPAAFADAVWDLASVVRP